MRTYGDQIKITSTNGIQYKTSANRPLDRATQYTYQFNGQTPNDPKTVGGSRQTLKALEPSVANALEQKLRGSKSDIENAVVTVEVPVLNRNNKTVMMPIQVRLDYDATNQQASVRTWYIKEDAFCISGLK